MASYELWHNGEQYKEIWKGGEEYVEAWTLVNGIPTKVWAKSGGNNRCFWFDTDFAYIIDLESGKCTTLTHATDKIRSSWEMVTYDVNRNYVAQYNPSRAITYDAEYVNFENELLGRYGRDLPISYAISNGIILPPRGGNGEVFVGRNAYSFSNDVSYSVREIAFADAQYTSVLSYIGEDSFKYETDNEYNYLIAMNSNRVLIMKADDTNFLIDLGSRFQSSLATQLYDNNTRKNFKVLPNGVMINDRQFNGFYYISSDFTQYGEVTPSTISSNVTSARFLYYNSLDGYYYFICIVGGSWSAVYRTTDLHNFEYYLDVSKTISIPFEGGGIAIVLGTSIHNFYNNNRSSVLVGLDNPTNPEMWVSTFTSSSNKQYLVVFEDWSGDKYHTFELDTQA